jgi:hypothetical protein
MVRRNAQALGPRAPIPTTSTEHSLNKFSRPYIVGAAAILALAASQVRAAEVAYISSSSGYVLAGNGTATTASWMGQAPLSGFSGYGLIQMNGKCLAGRTGGQPLTWEACRGDAAQKWSLSNKRLNNEGGWCADVEGNRSGPNVRVLAYKCSGQINQQWNAHFRETAQTAAASILNKNVQATFLQTAAFAKLGDTISTMTGQIISHDSGGLISQDGGGLKAMGQNNFLTMGK